MTVYFISSGAGHVKIGHSANPLRDLQCSNPNQLEIIRLVDGHQVERWIHRRFASHRIRGEWFQFSPEMLTITVPDEIPVRRSWTPHSQFESNGEFLREADRLGCLSAEMRLDYAPAPGGGPKVSALTDA